MFLNSLPYLRLQTLTHNCTVSFRQLWHQTVLLVLKCYWYSPIRRLANTTTVVMSPLTIILVIVMCSKLTFKKNVGSVNFNSSFRGRHSPQGHWLVATTGCLQGQAKISVQLSSYIMKSISSHNILI